MTRISQASIRDQMLVLNLPNAVNPTVWQFDLARARTSGIDVVQNDKGQYQLRLKTADGEMHEIAVYAARDGAVAVLDLIHGTLAGAGASAQAPESASTNWQLAALTVLVFVLLCSFVLSLFPGTGDRAASVATDAPALGTPQSAEDVLRGRVP